MADPLTAEELAVIRASRDGEWASYGLGSRALATIDALTAERDALAAWKRAAEPVIEGAYRTAECCDRRGSTVDSGPLRDALAAFDKGTGDDRAH